MGKVASIALLDAGLPQTFQSVAETIFAKRDKMRSACTTVIPEPRAFKLDQISLLVCCFFVMWSSDE